jgi:hypothetical protein
MTASSRRPFQATIGRVRSRSWKKTAKKFQEFFLVASSDPGLPDGLFSNQKYQFGKILDGLGLKNIDIFYGHLDFFTDIWDIL